MRKLILIVVLLSSVAGCRTAVTSTPGRGAPVSVFPASSTVSSPSGDSLVATVVVLREVPPASVEPNRPEWVRTGGGGQPEMPITAEEADRLRKESMRLPPNPLIQRLDMPAGTAIAALTPPVSSGFESLNFADDSSLTPPDPEVAVGPNHLMAVVNASLEVYDRQGATLVGPTTFGAFFSTTPGCTGLFDPNVLYDEKEDRFFVGIDSGGTGYCLAVTQTADPTGAWNLYRVPIGAGAFFDFPHAGIGEEVIVFSSNLFAGGSVSSEVYAFDKAVAYAGEEISIVTQPLSGDTPQPMHAQGFANGTWPATGPHYILTDHIFNGSSFGVWAWEDPLGGNSLSLVGVVDLNTFTGVNAGLPIAFPQMGSANTLQGNDFRVQDADYRNGSLWMAHTMACNPGAGTVNCVRWAEIDAATATVVQAGVIASDGEYRQFPNIAVDDAENVVLGYTKSSLSMFPGVYVVGREGSDSLNFMGDEIEVKAGELTYSGGDSEPHRWGDYTEAAADPSGDGFWYIGEYSEDVGGLSSTWGNYIAYLTHSLLFSDGFENGDLLAWDASVP